MQVDTHLEEGTDMWQGRRQPRRDRAPTHHLQLDLGARGFPPHSSKTAGKRSPHRAASLQGLRGRALQARHGPAHWGHLGPGLEQAPQLLSGRWEVKQRALRAHGE